MADVTPNFTQNPPGGLSVTLLSLCRQNRSVVFEANPELATSSNHVCVPFSISKAQQR
jgi:hypothetical protein